MHKHFLKILLATGENGRFAFIAVAGFVLAGLLIGTPEVTAQKRRAKNKSNAASGIKRASVRQKINQKRFRPAAAVTASSLLSPQSDPAPVSIVNLAEPDFLSGEASVTVGLGPECSFDRRISCIGWDEMV